MLLIDWIECISQLICMASCSIYSVLYAKKGRETWFFQLLSGAFACYFLGTLFYTLHFWIINDWPKIFSPSDLSFYGCYSFLFAANRVLIHLWDDTQRKAAQAYRRKALWAPTIVSVGHILYVVIAGGFINNLFYGIAISCLSYTVLWLFLFERSPHGNPTFLRYHTAELSFIVMELLVFLASAFGWDAGYYALTVLQFPTAIWMVAAAKKAVEP